MILDAVNKAIEIKLAGAVTTNELPCVSDYVDITTTTLVPGSTTLNTNGGTVIVIVPSPAGSTQRKVNGLSVYNADTVNAIVTVQFNSNGTTYLILKVTLSAGDRLDFTDTGGWKVSDNTGHLKTNSGTVSGPGSSVDNTIALFSGTAGTTIKAAANTGILKAASGVIATAVAGDADSILPTQALNTGKFLQTNATNASWAAAVVGQASSVDGEIALFSGVGGSTIKRSADTGILKATTGVLSAAVAGDADLILPTQTGNNGKYLKTDGANASWAGGSVLSGAGQATVDFGANPAATATVTVSAAWILTGSYIVVSVFDGTTADHDPGDAMLDRVTCYATNIVNGVSFDITASSQNGTWGKYLVNWFTL